MRNTKKGFALIEVIIAIVILSAVTLSATTLVLSAGNAVMRNQDRLTATYLAQECLEVSRNVRDNAWRNSLPWDCAWDAKSLSPNYCAELQAVVNKLKTGDKKIKILNKETKFSREITSTPMAKNEALLITCTVSWARGGEREAVSITQILTNWRKK